MWRISYLRNGIWNTIEEGQGGWINNSTGDNFANTAIYEWDGSNQAPVYAEAIRLQLYSDGVHDLFRIHLRGRGGNTQFSAGADLNTQPKASLVQFLPYNNPTTIDNIITGTQTSCNPSDNTYSQELIITYTNAPETGSLLINGQTFPITNSPQTITLIGLESDGIDVEIEAEFTDGYNTNYKSNGALFTAPTDCINIVVGVDETMTINGDYEVISGGSIEVFEGGSLTINGNLVINGQVVLNSISNKFSSLIVSGSSTGNIIYKRHVNAFNGSTGNDLISAPIISQNFGEFSSNNPNIFENPNNQDQKLFGPFNEQTGQYQTYSTINNNLTPMISGIGYRAARDASEDLISGTTFVFEGELETGIVNINLTETTSSTFEGWNLIGNPYPSYIDFDTFFNLNKAQLDDATYQAIYGYDGDANDGWTVLNNVTTNLLIAPGQGFFVKSKNAGGTITFTPAMRTDGTSDDFILGRTTASHFGFLKLEASSNGSTYSTDFYFNSNATSGLDPGYDAAIFGGNVPSFSIYSYLVQNDDGTPFTIQALNNSAMDNVIIPLGIEASQGQDITISIFETDIPESIDVYLEDTLTNTFTLLNSNNYTFTAGSDLNDGGRFYLRFEGDALGTPDSTIENINIAFNKNNEAVVISGQLKNETRLKIYDLNGKVLSSKSLDLETTIQSINVSHLSTGIYIVELISVTNEKRIQKLIIR